MRLIVVPSEWTMHIPMPLSDKSVRPTHEPWQTGNFSPRTLVTCGYSGRVLS